MASGSDDGIINTSINMEDAIMFIAICLCLVLLGGITSGLNVSLLSLDVKKSKLKIALSKKNLDVTATPNSDTQISMMKRVQPLIEDKHLLLVTLLVANATCMEALPIFLDELVASWLAVLISVAFVLIFGEILPQALFTSNPLKSGYKMYYVVQVLKWTFYPICKPIAFLLDLAFGKEHKQKGIVFSQREVSVILDEIQKHQDQKKVVLGAFKIADYTVEDSWTLWEDAQCIDANTKLDEQGLLTIYRTGLSRIPLYENTRDNVIGLLLVKSLILCDPDPQLTLKEYLLSKFQKVPQPAVVSSSTDLYDCINIFQKQKTHFAMVCNDKHDALDILDCWRTGEPIPERIEWRGIITLEDIMEDIIQEELEDEFDMQGLQLRSPPSHLKPNWSEDQSFVESVNSRFAAKHKRTMRAKQAKQNKSKQQKSNEFVLNKLEFSRSEQKNESIAIKKQSEVKPFYGSVQAD
eukprot:536065_1